LHDGRKRRVLKVVDQCARKALEMKSQASPLVRSAIYGQ
jgi:hypothetical protein